MQGTLVVLSFTGIFLRHPVGWVAGMAQGVLWIYVTFLVLFQRWRFFCWGVVKDLAQLKQVAPIICLLANRGFFAW